MSDLPPPPKAKKSVALSGVVAGNTAICTVGHTGNDLHYRGYDITEAAALGTYEEIAHLLIHEQLPTAAQLHAYRDKLQRLRQLPAPLRSVLEQIEVERKARLHHPFRFIEWRRIMTVVPSGGD